MAMGKKKTNKMSTGELPKRVSRLAKKVQADFGTSASVSARAAGRLRDDKKPIKNMDQLGLAYGRATKGLKKAAKKKSK